VGALPGAAVASRGDRLRVRGRLEVAQHAPPTGGRQVGVCGGQQVRGGGGSGKERETIRRGRR